MTARYETKVHASNRNVEYGTPVVVYADSPKEARKKAISYSWTGYTTDARVTILRVEEVQ